MAHPVTEAIGDVAQERLTPYEPEGPLEWLSFMQGIPEMLGTFTEALNNLGGKLAGDYPSPDGVPDMWDDMVATLRGVIDHGEQMAQRFEQDPRVQRALNPQPNEQVLDVQND